MTRIVVLGLTIISLLWAPVANSQSRTPQRNRRRFDFERLDTNSDGRISRKEFPGPPRIFNRLDANGDGFVSRAEVARFRWGRAGSHLGEHLSRVLDKDHDGRVSRQEFAAIADLFSQLDKNGDETLSSDELTGLASVPAAPGGVDVEALFEQYDTDQDGKLTETELKAAPQFKNPRFFTLLDEDRDGVVTKEEVRTFVRRHQSR